MPIHRRPEHPLREVDVAPGTQNHHNAERHQRVYHADREGDRGESYLRSSASHVMRCQTRPLRFRPAHCSCADLHPEVDADVRANVPVDVDTLGSLDEDQALRFKTKHAALGHVKHLLPAT